MLRVFAALDAEGSADGVALLCFFVNPGIDNTFLLLLISTPQSGVSSSIFAVTAPAVAGCAFPAAEVEPLVSIAVGCALGCLRSLISLGSSGTSSSLPDADSLSVCDPRSAFSEREGSECDLRKTAV